MVSLDQYLDSQVAKVAADVIKIYTVDFASRRMSNGRTLEQVVQDAEKIIEAYKKGGLKAAEEEISKYSKNKSLPTWYYLTHNSKEVTFYLLEKLEIEDCQVFKKEIIKCCEEEGERPALLDELDDSILKSYFNSFIIGYIQRLRFNLASKKAKKNIKKLVKKHYADILSLLNPGAGDLEALSWQNLTYVYCWSVIKEVLDLSEKFLAL